MTLPTSFCVFLSFSSHNNCPTAHRIQFKLQQRHFKGPKNACELFSMTSNEQRTTAAIHSSSYLSLFSFWLYHHTSNDKSSSKQSSEGNFHLAMGGNLENSVVDNGGGKKVNGSHSKWQSRCDCDSFFHVSWRRKDLRSLKVQRECRMSLLKH